ncbi:MAG: sensor histidine kinase [Rhodococcus sp.]|uniref:HAMP domain-containing sensor histidine kinase n=1 Tax=Rhodococcus TaxID=1827 RepID=UPI0016940BD1|nr:MULTISPECIES: ATP-binding protein [Rhodococcus]NLV78017.1 sensor histidine kinase [Rhodococcus sp. (in: high G+C Gram-positive bacteria)]
MDKRGIRMLRPRNWRLAYKLGVVLAVPLLAATVLGGFRVSSQLDDARRAAALAEQTAVAPAMLDFSRAVVTVATTASLGLPPQFQSSEDIERSKDFAERLAARSDLDPQIAQDIDSVLADGEALYLAAVDSQITPDELRRSTTDFLARCRNIIRVVFDLLEDNEALVDATNLLTVWDAQVNLLAQMESFRFLGTNPEAAQVVAQNAMNDEEATLGLLRGSRLDTGQIDAMLTDIASRRELVRTLEPTPEFGEQLGFAMISASQPYSDAIESATRKITVTMDRLASDARSAAIRDAILVGAILTFALVLALLVARSLSRPLQRLREGTLGAAHTDLPAAISAVKDGADIDSVRLPTIDVHTDEEIGQLSRAVDSMNNEALRLAGEQARLRKQVSVMLETLARRNKSLVEQQLSLIDSLEYQEKDPVRLQSMFALDHLAARMRRTGESLLVLAGTRPRTRTAPTLISDVLRGAVSQVENYQRVRIGTTPHGYFTGVAVNDVAHMIAELLDNALRASPPNSSVSFVLSPAVDGGLLLDIADSGIGIPADTLEEINTRLAQGDDADVDAPRQMGLFVVGRLAARNGINVRLRPTFDSETNAGVTASIYFPASMLLDVDTRAPAPMRERPRRLTLPRSESDTEYTSVPADRAAHHHRAPTEPPHPRTDRTNPPD